MKCIIEFLNCICLENCAINVKICHICNSQHYMSYAFDSKAKVKHFYREAFNLEYFQYSSETIFELALMKDLHSSILIQSSSFRSYAASYNYNRGYELNSRNKLVYQRLIEIYYCWQLCRFFSEFLAKTLTCKY
jgi:hypothetical protein